MLKLAACNIEGCTNSPKDSHRLQCSKHLTRLWRFGSFDLPTYPSVSKTCTRCEGKFIDSTKTKRMKFCQECRKLPNHKLFKRTYTWERSEKGRNHTKKYHKAKKAEYKKMVYDYYGWYCNCCDEDGEPFLTIDHVNNDGHLDRKQSITGIRLYQKIVADGFPAKYQILCMNCNFAKKNNEGICPHAN